jgi:hypothetical protein
MFLRNVGSHKIYTAQHPRRRHSFFPNLNPIASVLDTRKFTIQGMKILRFSSVKIQNATGDGSGSNYTQTEVPQTSIM